MAVRTALRVVLVAALAAHVGCAGPSPQPAIDGAVSAVERAEQAQARRYAAQELAKAREELQQAQEMAQSSSGWIEARRLAQKAQVDAELAIEMALLEQLRVSLIELRRSIHAAGSDDGGAGSSDR